MSISLFRLRFRPWFGTLAPLGTLATLALLSACASSPVASVLAGSPCVAPGFVVDDDFPGARRGRCEVLDDGSVRLQITPEDTGPINDSAWYAFRLRSTGAERARVILEYSGGGHRYQPKTSSDGDQWQTLAPAAVRVHWFGKRVTLTVPLDEAAVFVAGQELITPEDMQQWRNQLLAGGLLEQAVFGMSVAGRPLYRLDNNPAARELVFLVGRQHPPELTGALAFKAFFETLLADTELATRYRQRFHTLALPMLNPDGVVAGHWRHNLGGTDLNRDWGPFEQPETAAVARLLDEIDAAGKQMVVAVDFHSTRHNLIYTQMAEDVTRPANFSRDWIAAAMARLPDFEFEESPRPLSELATSRNHLYLRYGIPAVTYEAADEEQREVVRAAARVFAEEFMRLLLDTPPRASVAQ